jgi:hypothetical protein
MEDTQTTKQYESSQTSYTSNPSNPSNPSQSTNEPVKKPGRTLLLKLLASTTSTQTELLFTNCIGLVNKTQSKSPNSYFVTFDTVENSVIAYNNWSSDPTQFQVKYSYYRVFFTMNGLTDLTDYNQVKTQLISWVQNYSNGLVLYCKFYRKNNKYLGYGDFTVDTLDALNKLIHQTTETKLTYSFDTFSGLFYRFNSNKEKKFTI